MHALVALAGMKAQTVATLKSRVVLYFQPETRVRHKNMHWLMDFLSLPPHFSLIVILHLSLFAWRNAKHNEVQVQTQTPLPIPVYLTR